MTTQNGSSGFELIRAPRLVEIKNACLLASSAMQCNAVADTELSGKDGVCLPLTKKAGCGCSLKKSISLKKLVLVWHQIERRIVSARFLNSQVQFRQGSLTGSAVSFICCGPQLLGRKVQDYIY